MPGTAKQEFQHEHTASKCTNNSGTGETFQGIPEPWMRRVLPSTEFLKDVDWKDAFGRIFFLDDHGVFRPFSWDSVVSGELSDWTELDRMPFNIGEILQQFTAMPLDRIHHYAHTGEFLRVLFDERKLIDVVIRVAHKIFVAHRITLACHSMYFARAFILNQHRDHKLTEVTLKGFNPFAFQHVLRYIYSGVLYVNDCNVDSLMDVAVRLQMPAVYYKCRDFLGNLPVETSAPAMKVDANGLRAQFAHVINNFGSLATFATFRNLPIEAAEAILEDDNLKVGSEMDVFWAVINWVNSDPAKRRKFLDRLMRKVRFGCMTYAEILRCAQINEQMNFSPALKSRIMEASWLLTVRDMNTYDSFQVPCPQPRTCLRGLTNSDVAFQKAFNASSTDGFRESNAYTAFPKSFDNTVLGSAPTYAPRSETGRDPAVDDKSKEGISFTPLASSSFREPSGLAQSVRSASGRHVDHVSFQPSSKNIGDYGVERPPQSALSSGSQVLQTFPGGFDHWSQAGSTASMAGSTHRSKSPKTSILSKLKTKLLGSVESKVQSLMGDRSQATIRTAGSTVPSTVDSSLSGSVLQPAMGRSRILPGSGSRSWADQSAIASASMRSQGRAAGNWSSIFRHPEPPLRKDASLSRVFFRDDESARSSSIGWQKQADRTMLGPDASCITLASQGSLHGSAPGRPLASSSGANLRAGSPSPTHEFLESSLAPPRLSGLRFPEGVESGGRSTPLSPVSSMKPYFKVRISQFKDSQRRGRVTEVRCHMGTRTVPSLLAPGDVLAVGGFVDAGINESASQTTVYNGDGENWQKFSEMPETRINFATAFLNGMLYVIGVVNIYVQGNKGGYDPYETERRQRATRDVFKFDLKTRRWSKAGELNHPRAFLAACALGGRLYALGGQDDCEDVLETAEVYDPLTDTWSFIPPMICGRASACAVAFNGKVMVAGGYGQGNRDSTPSPVLASTECYDPLTGRWEVTGQLRVPRAQACMAQMDGKLIVCGGVAHNASTGNLDSMSSVDIYDPTSGQWSPLADLACPRHNAGAFIIGSRLFVVGGISGNNCRVLHSVECFDMTTRTWDRSVPDLPLGAKSLACLVLQDAAQR